MALRKSDCAKCGKPSCTARCARCKETTYCGRDCQVEHWKTHKDDCKGVAASAKKPAAAAAVQAAASAGQTVPGQPVFTDAEAMMAHLAKMGMPPEIMAKMTPEQKARMLATTKAPEVLSRAGERVAAEMGGLVAEQNKVLNDSVRAMGVEGKSVDGSLVPNKAGTYKWLDEKAQALVEVECPPGTKGQQVKVDLRANAITVTVGAAKVIDGAPFQPIDAAKSTWALTGLVLKVTLVKEKPMRWLQVVRS